MRTQKSFRPECLHEFFECSSDRARHAPAVVSSHGQVTYGELEAEANRLARVLRKRGAGPGVLIALHFERSPEAILAILATLKSGAAYVPIDPSYPEDRIRHILDESECLLFLTHRRLEDSARVIAKADLLVIDGMADEISAEAPIRLTREETGASPSDLCYVIYTSGTTGRPKGVMTEHRAACNYVAAFNEICATGPEDRIFQGFSLSFDGSVEEIWMAFSNGSSLVLGEPHVPRLGDELARFLAEQEVTYFSTVPTLLSTLSEPFPGLRTLVVSGEPCPQELVHRWSRPGIRMLNVYGPTEATVNTTASECAPGRPITIGKPLRGYELFILDPENRPVPRGESGELLIGGRTLARGYLRQPELTSERFVPTPPGLPTASPRLYRTGDWVRENQEGELEFFGRIDSQVKLRGYRIELTEIESLLLEDEQIRWAAVRLHPRHELQELCAYIVLSDPKRPLERQEVLERLKARLPRYMIPSYLDVLEEPPTLTSGKTDRKRLPAPVHPLTGQDELHTPPGDALESKLEKIWASEFGLPQVSVDSDFFTDLGGYSLLAAQMITRVRAETPFQVTLREAYAFPTIRKLAAHLSASAAVAAQDPSLVPASLVDEPKNTRSATESATAALQFLATFLLYGVALLPLVPLYHLFAGWRAGWIPISTLALLTAAAILLMRPMLLAFSVGAKWLLIGKAEPGAYPLWGWTHLRYWLAQRFHGLSGAAALAGSPCMSLYYRFMGARVGKNCVIDTAHCSAWDLVTIGDESCIGADTQLQGSRVERGLLLVGGVEIGDQCFIGIHSALGLNVRMEPGAVLDDQSLLPDGQVLRGSGTFRGSPAQAADVSLPAVPDSEARQRHPFWLGAAHFALVGILDLLIAAPGFGLAIAGTLASNEFPDHLVLLGILAVPFSFVLYCLWFALLKRTLLSRLLPGTYSVESVVYLRKWLSDLLMRRARALLLPLYTTIFLPSWLRLLGARIGRGAELSTIWQLAPELVEIGEESFFADGSIIGGKRLFRGHFEVGRNRIGRRSFVGNSAVLPVGADLGSGCLLGVQSLAPTQHQCAPDNTEWLGSPSFPLPHRKKAEGFSEAVTFRPDLRLISQRVVIDGLRILLSVYLAAGAAAATLLSFRIFHQRYGSAGTLLAALLVGPAIATGSALLVIGAKKLVMGRFRPVIRPLWSRYVWLNELINGLYEYVMAPALVPYLGTPFIVPFLRAIGIRIGRKCCIETTLFSEFDLVRIGDRVALNPGAVIQTHLFEDRVMKSSHLTLHDDSSVGNMAVVLYDSEIRKDAILGPLSLLMKGETIASGERWHGIPTALAKDPQREVVGGEIKTQLAG